jgi:gas vesicle protein
MKEIITKNSDLNEKNEEGGHNWIHTEVPIGLLTHTIGIAVGYRSNILPRKYEDIVEYLGGASKVLKPFFKDFGGKISKYMDGENTWLIESIFSTDVNKKIINIADLPPVMRYDSFINKLEIRLAKSGFDYKLENRSKIKCDLSIQIKGAVTKDEFNALALNISKLTKMIVKEDIIYIKDGNVMEFTSVKEYLDHFKGHLELVRLKRLIRNVENDTREQEYLEAKVLFLIFMMEKKRKNEEIVKFIANFVNSISVRLQRIEIVKLSPESLKQTRDEIETLKKNILKIKREIKEQEKIYKKISTDIHKNNKSISKKIQNELFEVNHYNGIEIFEVEEEIEEEQEEEFNN